jgi:hypothetical protein
MKEPNPMPIAQKAKELYAQELQARLEAEHFDEFVDIEPLSKSYFLARTFIDAALAARQAYPDRKSFVIRIGRLAAFHLGAAAS